MEDHEARIAAQSARMQAAFDAWILSGAVRAREVCGEPPFTPEEAAAYVERARGWFASCAPRTYWPEEFWKMATTG